ncbi:hypothetical protein ACK8P5_26195 (plasmid) [Paenibacillus sp. EC2-1]|uniref:hypothetical protein n=1 Tax=Paenibacillus sp. EC2-1 TaxID=3388665 RepID=UPI003BEEE2CC
MLLKSKSGVTTFSADVVTSYSDVEIHSIEGKIYAVKKGKTIGPVFGNFVSDESGEIKVSDLVPSVDYAALLAKNPAEMDKEELILLAEHLKNLAAGKLGTDAPAVKEETKSTKADKVAQAPVSAAKAEYTIEQLEAMGAKDLWKNVIQAIVDELPGITSRSKKHEMIEAYALYAGLGAESEEEDEEDDIVDNDSSQTPDPETDEEEDDEEEDDEDEDEDEDEDSEEDEDEDSEEDEDEDDSDEEDEDEDDSDEDEDSEEDEEEDDDSEEDEEEEDDSEDDEDEDSDEDEEEDDEDEDSEDEDDEEEDDELTPEYLDNLNDKNELQAIIKQYGVKIPKGQKLNVQTVKKIIKKHIFGEDK